MFEPRVPIRVESKHCLDDPNSTGHRNGAFAPFAPPTLQSDLWRHDRARIVS